VFKGVGSPLFIFASFACGNPVCINGFLGFTEVASTDQNGTWFGMLMLAIGCFLVGMIIAQYLRIFAVAPLAVLACFFAARGNLTGSLILDCALIVVCVQIGYLAGALIAIPRADPMVRYKTHDRHLATRDGQR
jgi:hypothetical protein